MHNTDETKLDMDRIVQRQGRANGEIHKNTLFQMDLVIFSVCCASQLPVANTERMVGFLQVRRGDPTVDSLQFFNRERKAVRD